MNPPVLIPETIHLRLGSLILYNEQSKTLPTAIDNYCTGGVSQVLALLAVFISSIFLFSLDTYEINMYYTDLMSVGAGEGTIVSHTGCSYEHVAYNIANLLLKHLYKTVLSIVKQFSALTSTDSAHLTCSSARAVVNFDALFSRSAVVCMFWLSSSFSATL